MATGTAAIDWKGFTVQAVGNPVPAYFVSDALKCFSCDPDVNGMLSPSLNLALYVLVENVTCHVTSYLGICLNSSGKYLITVSLAIARAVFEDAG
ncbi:MAG TPA: hypothetical protein VKP65_23765 [Rhodothermales bacterium]|nr:hypothetical protein [Rhodothermales bacterium]